jgi:hypothetical protein
LGGQAGQEPVFTGYPETSLTLASTTVLDSRLVVCEYRPKKAVAHHHTDGGA